MNIEKVLSKKYRSIFTKHFKQFERNINVYAQSDGRLTHYKRWALEDYSILYGYVLALLVGNHINDAKFDFIMNEIKIIKDRLYV